MSEKEKPRISAELMVGHVSGYPNKVCIKDYQHRVDGWLVMFGEKQVFLDDSELYELSRLFRDALYLRKGGIQ